MPDGARLVRICGLCLENGKEVDFSPEDRENLLKGMPDEGRRMADAMYERMLFGNKAYKELFRALEAGETPVLFHCSAGKDRTGVAAMLILLALGASDKTIAEDFEKTNIWRRPSWKPSGPSTLRRSPLTLPGRTSTSACSASTRSLLPSC